MGKGMIVRMTQIVRMIVGMTKIQKKNGHPNKNAVILLDLPTAVAPAITIKSLSQEKLYLDKLNMISKFVMLDIIPTII